MSFFDDIARLFRPSHRQRKRIIAQLKTDWHSTKKIDKDDASKVIKHLEDINEIIKRAKEKSETSN